VFATTGARDPRALLAAIAPAARLIIATAPRLHGKDAVPPETLARHARELGLAVRAVEDPAAAVEEALARCAGGPVVVTGSLYLVGQVRDRWFPWPQVVLQRTSWPG
jgi:dihydrofolate synthase / folylpolyglutamate synthase